MRTREQAEREHLERWERAVESARWRRYRERRKFWQHYEGEAVQDCIVALNTYGNRLHWLRDILSGAFDGQKLAPEAVRFLSRRIGEVMEMENGVLALLREVSDESTRGD